MKNKVKEEYISNFVNWYKKSTVRSAPRRELIEKTFDTKGLNFYSTAAAPLSVHPTIIKNGHQPQILLIYLYNLLGFTTQLECEVVNLSIDRIGRHQLQYDFSNEMKIDAFKIYCDEAYHALFTADFTFQIRNYLNINNRRYQSYIDQHAFFLTTRKLRMNRSKRDAYLIDLAASIVSETLITNTLKRIPRDKSVIIPVREIIADHAQDEGLHHIYFCKLFTILWEQLNEQEQLLVGQVIPQFISAFVAPNFLLFKHFFSELGYTAKESEQIIRETYSEEALFENKQNTSSQLMRLLHNNKIFDNYKIRLAFISEGLSFPQQQQV